MPVPSVMADLSTTAASNSPAGTDAIGTSLDDYLRATQGILRTTNAKGSDIASASSIDLGAATSEFVDITGTTTITALGTVSAGIVRTVRFTGVLTLTYNATTLILPGSANIQTAAGDCAIFRSLGSGNWVCIGYFPRAQSPAVATINESGAFAGPRNLSLAASVSANALTIAIKTASGSDPSVASPVQIPVRSATAATGTYSQRSLTAATSITVPSGATLGAASGIPFRIWVLWLDDGTDTSLAVFNALDQTTLTIHRLSSEPTGIYTASTIGTGSDSAGVLYADGAPSTNIGVRVLGYLNWSSGLTVAGTWDAGPTRISLLGQDVRLPGEVVQSVLSRDGASSSGTTTLPFDNTTPQNTEGIQFMTATIAPMDVSNVLEIEHSGFYGHSAAVAGITAALFVDTTANALAVSFAGKEATADTTTMLHLMHRLQVPSVSSQTYKIRAGNANAGTTFFNRNTAADLFNGLLASRLVVNEIQA